MNNRENAKLSRACAYFTDWGEAYCGNSMELLAEFPDESINLVITSPPFALQRRKEYGNREQGEYVDWLAEFAQVVHCKLKNDGSFVLDLVRSISEGCPSKKPLQLSDSHPLL